MSNWFILITLLLCSHVYGQDGIESDIEPKNFIYYEFAGPGGVGSINYERNALQYGKWEALVRLGIGTVKLKDFRDKFNPDLNVVFNGHVTYGGRHKAEAYFGSVFANSVLAGENLTPERSTTTHLNIGCGYRFEATSTGLFGRISYVYLTDLKTNDRHWASLAIGITF